MNGSLDLSACTVVSAICIPVIVAMWRALLAANQRAADLDHALLLEKEARIADLERMVAMKEKSAAPSSEGFLP